MKSKPKRISNEDRERIVDSYINGSRQQEIAKIMGFRPRTVYTIIKKYIDGEDYTIKASRGEGGEMKKKIMPESQRKMIQSWVDEDSTMSINAIKKKLMNEIEIKVSADIISRSLNDFNYSFKRINLASQNNDTLTLEFRAFYANNFINDILKLNDSRVIFINDATFNITMRTINRITKKKIKVDPFNNMLRKKNVSICCGMNKTEIIEWQTQPKRFSTESFYQFIKSILFKLTQKNIKEAVIIMDHEYIEKDLKIKESIEASDHTLICLPPYSLFLNPIEYMYAKWKQLVRANGPQNEDELYNVFNSALSEITHTDCKDFYERMLDFLPKCIGKEEVLYE